MCELPENEKGKNLRNLSELQSLNSLHYTALPKVSFYFKIPNFDEIGELGYPIARTHVFSYS